MHKHAITVLCRCALIGFSMSLIIACSCTPRGENAQGGADSAVAGQDSTWQRAQFVLDSLSLQVNTDSLFRIMQAMLTSPDTMFVSRALSCEFTQLYWTHGSIPASRAIERMQDTAWRGVSRSMRRKLEQYPGRPISSISTPDCQDGPPAPDSIRGVRLNVEPRYPRRNDGNAASQR